MDKIASEVSGVLIPFRQRKRKKFEKVYVNEKRPEAGFIPGLLRRTDNGVYYVRKAKDGKPELFESLGTAAKDQAKAWAERKIAEYLGGLYLPEAKRAQKPTIEALVDEHLPVLEKLMREGKRRPDTYANDLAWAPFIKKHFGDARVDQFTAKAWKDWYECEFPKTGLKKLDDIAKHLSKTLTFAIEQDYIVAKPKLTNFQKKGRQDKPRSRAYSREEIKAIADACLTLEEQLKMMLHIECGMRSGEVRKLTWEYVTLQKRRTQISLPGSFTKTWKDRAFYVSPKAAALFKAQRLITGSGVYVFPSSRKPGQPETRMAYNRKWQRVFKRAGVAGIPYWFRHTFYTATLFDAKMPIQLVSDYAGTSMATLERHYLHGDAEKTRDVSVSIRDKYVTMKFSAPQVPVKKSKKS